MVPSTWPSTGEQDCWERLAQAREAAAHSSEPGSWTQPQGGPSRRAETASSGYGATPCPLFGGFASPSSGSPPSGLGRPHEPRGRRAHGRRGREAPNSKWGAPKPWVHLGGGRLTLCAPLALNPPTPALRGVRSSSLSWEEKGGRTAAGSPISNGVVSGRRPREPRDSPWARGPGSPGAVAKSEWVYGSPRGPHINLHPQRLLTAPPPPGAQAATPSRCPPPRGASSPPPGSARLPATPEPPHMAPGAKSQGPRHSGRPGPAAAPARRVLAPPLASRRFRPGRRAEPWGAAGGPAPGRCRRGWVRGGRAPARGTRAPRLLLWAACSDNDNNNSLPENI